MSEMVNVKIDLTRDELLALIVDRAEDLSSDIKNDYETQDVWVVKVDRLAIMLKALPPAPPEE
jgi:hypothetical protein